MIDLRRELTGLCQIYQQLAARRHGVVLQFMGVRPGAGVSTCARAFARSVAPRARRGVWLFDLDFYANTHYALFSSPKAQALYGAVGPARSAVMQDAPLFWRIHPELVREDGRKAGDRYYLNMHQVGTHSLYISQFRHDLLRAKQQVHIRPAKAYWAQMRKQVDLAIIDAPILSRGHSGLATAPDADGVVIVANPHEDPAQIHNLRQHIEGRGGRCLGVIYNDAPLAGSDPAVQAAQ